ncbi:MAG: GNAT family N-acetyltransferase [Panacagrimonas sp.]
MPDVRVRAATLDDAPAILELEALFPSDRMSARSVRRFLRSEKARVWVADDGTRVQGNLVLLLRSGSTAARIYSVIVDPDARGLGLGHRLVEAAERSARKLGLQRIALEVRADNLAARKLYASRGYRIEREMAGYYDDGADGLRLGKAL